MVKTSRQGGRNRNKNKNEEDERIVVEVINVNADSSCLPSFRQFHSSMWFFFRCLFFCFFVVAVVVVPFYSINGGNDVTKYLSIVVSTQ